MWIIDIFKKIKNLLNKKSPTDNNVPLTVEGRQSGITPNQRYLYETFKMRGIQARMNEPLGPFTADLLLPRLRIAVLCLRKDKNDPLIKVKIHQLRKYARTLGCRLFIVRDQSFYKDMEKILLYSEFYAKNRQGQEDKGN